MAECVADVSKADWQAAQTAGGTAFDNLDADPIAVTWSNSGVLVPRPPDWDDAATAASAPALISLIATGAFTQRLSDISAITHQAGHIVYRGVMRDDAARAVVDALCAGIASSPADDSAGAMWTRDVIAALIGSIRHVYPTAHKFAGRWLWSHDGEPIHSEIAQAFGISRQFQAAPVPGIPIHLPFDLT